MERSLRIVGQMPPNWEQGLALLRRDLGLVPADTGLEVVCCQGDSLAVECDGKTVKLSWQTPVQFYRALSLIPDPLAPCAIHEKPRFESCGVMFDCSRNAVLKPEAVKTFLRKMAVMGLNLGMLYTEDTYEVPELPFFGYKRGRYTYEELKDLDDYADIFGIELCPCIQTLGHLKRMLHWPAYGHLQDNESVLLADLDATYETLDCMIRAATAPFRSKRIHLGMDEAFGVGMGKHFARFGYEHPHAIMGRHLSRVLDIADKYGLKAMMWSDMYFQLDGHGYYEGGMPSQRAIDAVDKRVSLVYWDYYHDKREDYDDALLKHAQFPVETIFAGGIWTWAGPAPSYHLTIANTVPALTAVMDSHVKTAFATCWGDNGAETNLLTALLGLQMYAEMNYSGVYDEAVLRTRFRRCCHADAQAFLDMSAFNILPGMVSPWDMPTNLCKFMLYQDPLVQLFEADIEPFDLETHFAGLTGKFARYARQNPEFSLLLDFYTALAHALSLKCRWHAQAGDIVRSGDRDRALALAEEVPAMVDALDALRSLWRRLWESTNKPQGFEVIEVRMGGIAARMATAGEKMRSFALGEVDTIPELTEPSLPFKRRENGVFEGTNIMEQIATASVIDW